jgi:TetR/AcrR family transcriptional regulator, fatty acid metabolism regulator protein
MVQCRPTRAILPELLTNPGLRARYFDEVVAPTMTLGEGAILALAAAGRLRDLDAALTTRMLAGSLLGLMVLQLLGDETLAARWQEIPDVLADLLLPGFMPMLGPEALKSDDVG